MAVKTTKTTTSKKSVDKRYRTAEHFTATGDGMTVTLPKKKEKK